MLCPPPGAPFPSLSECPSWVPHDSDQASCPESPLEPQVPKAGPGTAPRAGAGKPAWEGAQGGSEHGDSVSPWQVVGQSGPPSGLQGCPSSPTEMPDQDHPWIPNPGAARACPGCRTSVPGHSGSPAGDAPQPALGPLGRNSEHEAGTPGWALGLWGIFHCVHPGC